MTVHGVQRVVLHADPPREAVTCWHCRRAVGGEYAARYLYPGERPGTAIVEDWFRCDCGAYQNSRRTSAFAIRPVERT